MHRRGETHVEFRRVSSPCSRSPREYLAARDVAHVRLRPCVGDSPQARVQLRRCQRRKVRHALPHDRQHQRDRVGLARAHCRRFLTRTMARSVSHWSTLAFTCTPALSCLKGRFVCFSARRAAAPLVPQRRALMDELVGRDGEGCGCVCGGGKGLKRASAQRASSARCRNARCDATLTDPLATTFSLDFTMQRTASRCASVAAKRRPSAAGGRTPRAKRGGPSSLRHRSPRQGPRRRVGAHAAACDSLRFFELARRRWRTAPLGLARRAVCQRRDATARRRLSVSAHAFGVRVAVGAIAETLQNTTCVTLSGARVVSRQRTSASLRLPTARNGSAHPHTKISGAARGE